MSVKSLHRQYLGSKRSPSQVRKLEVCKHTKPIPKEIPEIQNKNEQKQKTNHNEVSKERQNDVNVMAQNMNWLTALERVMLTTQRSLKKTDCDTVRGKSCMTENCLRNENMCSYCVSIKKN